MAYEQGGHCQPCTTTKVERKVIEKNRRNHMKTLCYKLNSLLPNFNPSELLPRVEQIEEAIKYIKSLEAKVKMAQEKKQSLLMGSKKRSHGGNMETLIKPPIIEVHEMGSTIQIFVTCGFDDQFIFNEIIRILHEEKIEVLSANFSLAGDSMLIVVHAEIRYFFQFGATEVSERLKIFVYGHWLNFQSA